MNEQKKTMTQETQNREEFIMLPTVDFCFKELMQNAKVRQGMIAALLGVEPEEIEETILLPTILHPEYPDDKYGILDVKVVLKNGSQMDFEMQVTAVSYWTKRILFYLGKMYTDQLKAGESNEKLKKCIHVGILNFIQFPDDDRCYRKIIFCDKDTGEEYTDLLEIHVLELKKLPEKEQNESGIIRWMRFLGAKSRKEFEKMAKEDTYIDEAYEMLKHMSADEKKRLEIIYNLTVDDFCYVRNNDHRNYSNEKFYVFSKKIKLIKRFDFDEQLVGIYIKFNKLEDGFCFIISFHELEHPINKYFK